jgi:hypothetical protein
MDILFDDNIKLNLHFLHMCKWFKYSDYTLLKRETNIKCMCLFLGKQLRILKTVQKATSNFCSSFNTY